jgi:hypothetical protein
MAKCILCDTELTPENMSEEHIIPNAIGGKLKSTKLICCICNGKVNDEFEKEALKLLNFFAVMLDIGRDRGDNQPLTAKGSDGKEYKVYSGGKPSLADPNYEIKDEKDYKVVSFEARTKSELNHILKDLKKKYPNLDIESIKNQAIHKSEYLKEPINISFSMGGKAFFQCMTKILIEFLKYRIPNVCVDLSKVIQFINGKEEYEEIYYFYPENGMVETPENSIFHSIVIKSYPSERMLVGFIELFSAISIVMIISDNFSEIIQEEYVYDLVERKEISEANINIPIISKSLLYNIFEQKVSPNEQINSKMSRFYEIARKIQISKHQEELIDSAMKVIPKENENITKENIDDFSNDLAEKIAPFIKALTKR